MAVMCISEPLICALRASSAPSEEASGGVPALGRSSSLKTHLNLRRGSCLVRLKRRRKAAPNGQPVTFQNSATRMRVGSIFKAAPIEEKKRTGREVA